jgi:AAT family amino acid transporter
MAGWAAALGVGWTVLKARNPQVAERRAPEFEKVG